jgi:Holliday junction resolvase RusA-like endonuclease
MNPPLFALLGALRASAIQLLVFIRHHFPQKAQPFHIGLMSPWSSSVLLSTPSFLLCSPNGRSPTIMCPHQRGTFVSSAHQASCGALTLTSDITTMAANQIFTSGGAPTINVEDGSIAFLIHGKPMPLPRPRFGQGRACSKERPAMDKHKAVVREIASTTNATGPCFGAVPLSVNVVFSFQRPKSHFKGRVSSMALHEDAPLFPGKNLGDADNLVKWTLDAMSKTVCSDDAAVVTVTSTKRFAASSHTKITVSNLIVVLQTALILDLPSIAFCRHTVSVLKDTSLFKKT